MLQEDTISIGDGLCVPIPRDDGQSDHHYAGEKDCSGHSVVGCSSGCTIDKSKWAKCCLKDRLDTSERIWISDLNYWIHAPAPEIYHDKPVDREHHKRSGDDADRSCAKPSQ